MKSNIVMVFSLVFVTIIGADNVDVEKNQRREVKTEKRNIHHKKKFFDDKSEIFFNGRTADKRGISSVGFVNSDDGGDTFDDFSSPNHEVPLSESQEYTSESYANQMHNYDAGHETTNGDHSNFGGGFEQPFFNGHASFMSNTKTSFGSNEGTNTVGTGFSSEGEYRELESNPKTVYITKEVPVPYPVHVEKKIPYYVKVPVDKPVPVAVHKPYPVHIEKQVPFPIKIHVPKPYPVTIEKYIPYPVRVQIDKPFPVHVPKPYPIVVEKRIPFPVDKPIPFPVKVPVDRPYTVHIPIEKPVAVTIEKKVPYAVRIPIDRPYAVHVPKPYPITIERTVPYPIEKPIPVPVKVPVKMPIKVPYPVEIKVPVHIQAHSPQEEHHYFGQEASQGGHQFDNSYENGVSHVNNAFLGFRNFKGGHNSVGLSGITTTLGGGENVLSSSFEFPEGFTDSANLGHEYHGNFRRGFITRGDARLS